MLLVGGGVRAVVPRFNSATAHHRGNAGGVAVAWWAYTALQFGHGSSPWKCPRRYSTVGPPASLLQFGHGSSPWKCQVVPVRPGRRLAASIRPRLITVEMRPRKRPSGSSGTAASIRPRLITVEMRWASRASCRWWRSFNSATAHHRGNAGSPLWAASAGRELQFGHGSSPWKCAPPRRPTPPAGRRFNSATAHHRGNAATPVRKPTASSSASIRPRLITVEMPRSSGRGGVVSSGFNSATAHHRGNALVQMMGEAAATWLQFGHGSSPWKCIES